ncbi:hypothetical protein HJ590_09500 [Naumannella sp. ID2617S]|nr:hypothetical protein [Naumannella sp. ID2617S]
MKRRGLLALLVGAAALPVVGCSSNARCREQYIAQYRSTHGGESPTETQIASACQSRSRTGSGGGNYGTGYRGSRRGGSSSSSGGK